MADTNVTTLRPAAQPDRTNAEQQRRFRRRRKARKSVSGGVMPPVAVPVTPQRNSAIDVGTLLQP